MQIARTGPRLPLCYNTFHLTKSIRTAPCSCFQLVGSQKLQIMKFYFPLVSLLQVQGSVVKLAIMNMQVCWKTWHIKLYLMTFGKSQRAAQLNHFNIDSRGLNWKLVECFLVHAAEKWESLNTAKSVKHKAKAEGKFCFSPSVAEIHLLYCRVSTQWKVISQIMGWGNEWAPARLPLLQHFAALAKPSAPLTRESSKSTYLQYHSRRW